MAIKKITKITKTDKTPKKPDPVAKANSKVGDKLKAGDSRTVGNKTTTFKAPSKGGWGDSAYVAKNFVDGDSKIDSVASVKKKKVASNGSGEKLRKIVKNSPVSHY